MATSPLMFPPLSMHNGDRSIIKSNLDRESSSRNPSEQQHGLKCSIASTHDSLTSFPILPLQDLELPTDSSNSSIDDPLRHMLKPVALRPLSLNKLNRLALRPDQEKAIGEPHKHRPLELALANDQQVLLDENCQSFDMSRNENNRVYAPKLSIKSRRTKPQQGLASSLLRRGAEEQAYLQGQLKAEANQRRRQQLHNEERKLRQNFKTEEEEGACDDEVQSMIDKFNFGFGGMEGKPKDRNETNNPNPKGSKTFRDFAGSPPAILKKTFRRSVSAVLADSGKNDEDNFVLCFPNGAPFLDDEQALEDGSNSGQSELVGQPSFDETCSLSTFFEFDAEDFSPRHSLIDSGNSSPSTSPQQATVEDDGQELTAPELSLPNKANKKVMLRPKMAIRRSSASTATHSEEDACENDELSSDIIADHTGALMSDNMLDENKCTPLTGSSFSSFLFRRKGLGKKHLAASESFQELSHEDQAEDVEPNNIPVVYHPDLNMFPGRNTAAFDFSSPESRKLPASKALFKQVNDCEGFVFSAGNESHLALKELLSETNYHTPDHSSAVEFQRKKFGPKLFGGGSGSRMSTLPELFLPALGVPSNSHQSGMIHLDDSISRHVAMPNQFVGGHLINKNVQKEVSFNMLKEFSHRPSSEQLQNEESQCIKLPMIETPSHETMKTPC